MINFFRKKRKTLADDNKAIKYVRYAIGEIVLVVVGILIALQINSWNNQRVDRIKEIKYLINIKQDLLKDLKNIRYNIEFREEKQIGTKQIIDQINGLPTDDLTALSFHVINSLNMERFQPNNITFKEMVNSGSVSLISNDSILKLLLELDLLYQTNTWGIEHEAFDYQEFISKPLMKSIDIEPLSQVFSQEKTAEEAIIKKEDFDALFQNREFKNGSILLNWTSEYFITILNEIENKSKNIIKYIDKELEK